MTVSAVGNTSIARPTNSSPSVVGGTNQSTKKKVQDLFASIFGVFGMCVLPIAAMCLLVIPKDRGSSIAIAAAIMFGIAAISWVAGCVVLIRCVGARQTSAAQ